MADGRCLASHVVPSAAAGGSPDVQQPRGRLESQPAGTTGQDSLWADQLHCTSVLHVAIVDGAHMQRTWMYVHMYVYLGNIHKFARVQALAKLYVYNVVSTIAQCASV